MGVAWRDLPAYWEDLFRSDILNCIGASMLVVPLIAAPRRGRPAWLPTTIAALAFVAHGPIIGPAHFPTFIPSMLSAYIGGQRPMSWFPLFPWVAWPLADEEIGHLWVRGSARDRRRQAMVFVSTGLGGLALIGIVDGIRAIDPHIIRYPRELVQQMGPGSFFYRLGMNLILAKQNKKTNKTDKKRFSITRQFGRTSLL